jgi:alkanesulfonate monooxygenase SsuD/methylene tetrahydromethanopterin reductase-like flavin-dependent oxidoreductase (luciferase family)
MLRFGVGLLGHYSRLYTVERVAELAAVAERLGYDSYWVADQRWMRDVWVTPCGPRRSGSGPGSPTRTSGIRP